MIPVVVLCEGEGLVFRSSSSVQVVRALLPLPCSPHVGVYRRCGLTREESEEGWDGGRKEEVVSQPWP